MSPVSIYIYTFDIYGDVAGNDIEMLVLVWSNTNSIIIEAVRKASRHSKSTIHNQMLWKIIIRGIKMVDFFKRHFVMLLIACVLIVITVIVFLYLNMNKKGKENYIATFHKNKNIVEEISSSLMSIENEMSILKESGQFVVSQNGKTTEISEYILDEETKSNIERAIKDMGIGSINKSNTYLEFVYDSNKDLHSIAYTTDKNQLISYTNVQHLEGNWYYCYIFNE